MNTSTVQQLPAGERQGIIQWAGQHFGVDAGKVLATLKSTCFKGPKEGNEFKDPTDAEVAALLIVAREHGLNPFLKEIYAFPAKGGGIVPIVSIDGWINIVNRHPNYNGVEFIYAESEKPAWIECHMHRKDRSHPIKVRELLAECQRDTGPWKSHPSRMLRHKAFIQCARVAFGFAGIYDPDEGEAIVEVQGRVIDHPTTETSKKGTAGLNAALGVGATTAEVEGAEARADKPAGTLDLRDNFVKRFGDCKDSEILALVRDEANGYLWTVADREVLDTEYSKHQDRLAGGKG
jgi:phage recombination protein Bet